MRSERGFSLIELMAVLSLLAVALGLVIPRLFALDSGDEQSDLHRMAGLLVQASHKAELDGLPIRMRVGRDSYRFEQLSLDDKWQLLSESPFATVEMQGAFIASVKATALMLTSLPSGDASGVESVSGEVGYVLLLPDGTVSPVEIHLSGMAGHGREVSVLHTGPGKVAYVQSAK